MIRSLPTTMLSSALLLASAASAAELSASGSVDAGYKTNLDSLANSPVSGYNLEANFTLDAKLSDKVSAQVFATALTGGVGVPGEFGPGVDSAGNYLQRWPFFAFDGAAIVWKLSDSKTLTIGDVVSAKGSVAYYAAKRYSTVTRVAAIRGVGYSDGAFSGFFGANDASDILYTAGASYTFAIDSSSSVEPAATITVGEKSDFPWNGGVQYKGKFGAFALSASAAGYGGKDTADKSKFGYVLVAEPSYTTEAFYLASAALFAPKAKDGLGDLFAYPLRHGRTYKAWGDDMTFYVEPGVNFAGGAAAAGLAVEYHEPSMDADKDEYIYIIPNLYLYPVKDMTITLWAEADKYMEDKAMTFALGLETVFKF
ncbi:MAG: hypothetical protein IPK50_12505 [Fibrobacterota bacterium]|nr:MAG: hypothetical protein IPK50_12505 [Fibrobacterota bacterium]